MKTRHIAKLIALPLVAAACAGRGERAARDPEADRDSTIFSVAVVNYPLAYFAERIGGENVVVLFPAPADVDPALWSPGPDEVASYQSADLILLNGADYAKWIPRASLPTATLVHTGAAYLDRLIPLSDTVTHTHGPAGEHSHEGVAFTTWLDPTLAREQARAVAEALEKARPGDADGIGKRLRELDADLQDIDARLESTTGALGHAPILFSHPVYQYFEHRYGLNARSVHWEPDAEPSRRQWSEIEKLLREWPANWMIWEAEPAAGVVTRLEELGVRSLVFAPCANRVEDDDFLSVMRANVARLEEAWGTNGEADSPAS